MLYQLTICVPVGATSDTLACDCFVHQYGAIAAGRRAPHYPSDMTDAEWAQVRASMPVPAWLEGRGGRPEAYCHRETVDAVRYVVGNGAKWRATPVDLPAPRKVYDFFRRWSRHGYVRELYQRLRRLQREREGRTAEPSAGIMDAQSADGSEACPTATRGIDGNKRRDGSGSREGSHLPALTEPCVTVSRYTDLAALISDQ